MTESPRSKLPRATIERWQAIVLKAARSGTDISQLVQHFAEQSFQNKVVLLEAQGIHRRALTNMRQVLLREADRAEQASRGPLQKNGQLLRSYEASRFVFAPPMPNAPSQPAGRKVSIKDVPMGFSGDDHGCTIVPLKPNLISPEQLRSYVAGLHDQMGKIDEDIAGIDKVLNQGMRNHQAVVDDLAATSRELYQIAQQVLADLAPLAAVGQAGSEPVFVPPEPMEGDNTKTYADAGPAAADVSPAADTPVPARPSTPADLVRDSVRQLWSKVTKR